jgi:glycosyltransferase involved in cell wall biosynthesis
MNILILAGSRSTFNQLRPEYEAFIKIANNGHFLTVVIHEDSPYVPRLREVGIRMIHCYPEKKIDLAAIKELRAELRQHRYDIIYATTSKTIPNAAFAALGFPARVVAYRGTTGGLYRHDPTAYLTILHPRVNGVICVSDAVKEEIKKQVWKNKEAVVTIHKGHDLQWYSAEPADLSEFGISHDDFVIICAVNVRPSKGIDVMLEAANRLAELPNLHLILAGKGMDKEPYKRLIEENRLRDRIHVAGFRTDAPELIAASDVLVQPSISGEGLPRAVMEAMSYGTTVVITDTGGGKEVVVDGKSGFVVPVKDPDAICNRVVALYNDRALLSRMSADAKHRIQNEFSSGRTAEQMITYFRQLTETTR